MSGPQPIAGAVYAIADAGLLGLAALPAAVAEMATAGIETVQLRLKDGSPDQELFAVVEACVRSLEGARVQLWIDDRADLAAFFHLPGLHLGQRDLPPKAARQVVGEGCWLGLSTHDEAEVGAAEADPEVAVVAIGPVYPTGTKLNPEPTVGIEGIRRARKLTSKKLVAIGGIEASTLGVVLAAGADAAAVAGALGRDLTTPGALARNCRALVAAAGG